MEDSKMLTQNKVQEFASVIAPLLGDGWVYRHPTEYDRIGRIDDPGGAMICVDLDEMKNRLMFGGVAPKGAHDVMTWSHMKISVAAARPAPEIAREIMRRLIPAYLLQYTRAS